LIIDIFFGLIFIDERRQGLLSRDANTAEIRTIEDISIGRALQANRYQVK
jgi:hypothetical protein